MHSAELKSSNVVAAGSCGCVLEGLYLSSAGQRCQGGWSDVIRRIKYITVYQEIAFAG